MKLKPVGYGQNTDDPVALSLIIMFKLKERYFFLTRLINHCGILSYIYRERPNRRY